MSNTCTFCSHLLKTVLIIYFGKNSGKFLAKNTFFFLYKRCTAVSKTTSIPFSSIGSKSVASFCTLLSTSNFRTEKRTTKKLILWTQRQFLRSILKRVYHWEEDIICPPLQHSIFTELRFIREAKLMMNSCGKRPVVAQNVSWFLRTEFIGHNMTMKQKGCYVLRMNMHSNIHVLLLLS